MSNRTAFFVILMILAGQLLSFWRHNPFRLLGGIALALPIITVAMPVIGRAGRLAVLSTALTEMDKAGELELYPRWTAHYAAKTLARCVTRFKEDHDDR